MATPNDVISAELEKLEKVLNEVVSIGPTWPRNRLLAVKKTDKPSSRLSRRPGPSKRARTFRAANPQLPPPSTPDCSLLYGPSIRHLMLLNMRLYVVSCGVSSYGNINGHSDRHRYKQSQCSSATSRS